MLDVLSPVTGLVVPLSEIPDSLFSLGMMGPGMAVRPQGGRIDVFAPIPGVVCKVRNHGVVFMNEFSDVTFILHLGLGLAEIENTHCDMRIHKGRHVDAGDLVCKWDIDDSDENLLPYAIVIAVQQHTQLIDMASGHINAKRSLFSLPLPE